MSRPRLQTVILEVTQACDHACSHCYNIWNHPQAAAAAVTAAPVDVRPLLAHVLAQVDCHHVTLTGGEPLLRDDLPDIVSFAARLAQVNLITNGHRLDELTVADLIRRGVALFELPLLSYRREAHDELSAAPGAFDAVLAALAHIRTHRGKAVAVFVATRRNIGDLHDTLKLAAAFGVRGVMLNRFNPGGRGSAHLDLLPTLGEMREALEVAESASQVLRLPISCSIPIQPCLIDPTAYPHLGFGFCAAGSGRAYPTFDAAGNVRPCNHAPTMLGNVWEEPLADILAPERIAGFAAATPTFCTPCTLKDECQGGCKASAQVCYGDLSVPEPFLQANLDWARPILSQEGQRGSSRTGRFG
ncbi:MAG: radical SAM protein [Anaerolineae bacterium]|nr:radical SAM protein [Anaerolineae bacterium]